MPVEKKARGKKKQKKKKNDPRKLEILDACFALGDACNAVSDWDDAIRYCERARAGYEEQQGRDSEKTLDVTNILIFARTCQGERIEKCRDLLKRCERALGEENVVTLKTLNKLGCELAEKEEHEEAREVHERCLAGRMKVLGEDHKDTCATLNNLGLVYNDGLKNHEKALECL
ncbi:hypothetical protein TL16_g08463 [Triparma laevis f. inornata]|uniref:Kinesin light chain n=2 Tax=Triparma laevis TaxID=1534972 RepID=A0A9W7C0E2_9STRA|nr:hypothetical protein TL16_g08463 [Triparma laevis f. inornata]GMH99681.1 hypothetical protein TrLO_g1741 [Triparma laevis f. longispina]